MSVKIRYPVHKRKGGKCNGCGKQVAPDEFLLSIETEGSRFVIGPCFCEECQAELVRLISHKENLMDPNIISPLPVKSPKYYRREHNSFYKALCPNCGRQIGSVTSKRRCYFCLQAIIWPNKEGEINGDTRQ